MRASTPLGDSWQEALPSSVTTELDAAVEAHRFVALGEGDHYVEEKYAYRLAFMKSLVLHDGIHQVVMEMGGSDAARVDRYLDTGDEHWLDRVVLYGYLGENDLERRELSPFQSQGQSKACGDRFAGSERRFWRALRTISETSRAQTGQRVQLFGFDFDALPGGGFQDARDLIGTCQAAAIVEHLGAELTPPPGSSGAAEVTRIEAVAAEIETSRAELTQACGGLAVNALARTLSLLAFSYRTSMDWAATSMDTSPEGALRYRQMFITREQHMYTQLQWLLGTIAPSEHVLLLGHDLHLAHDSEALRFGEAPHDLPMWASLGTLLEQDAKGSVYTLWLLYGKGTRLAQQPTGACEQEVALRSGTLEDWLSRGPAPYFLPFSTAPADLVIGRDVPFGTPTSQGSGPIRTSAEALVYLPTASASRGP